MSLRDGSVLWLFGDTAARDDAGRIEYFVIGTASWAPADHPTETQDAVDPTTGTPIEFATPTTDFPNCDDATLTEGMWPASAVVVPEGARDRVVVWLHNICLGNGTGALIDRGMSVAEWWYDPANPPAGQPIRATILNQRLFEHRSYGSAATLTAEGSVRVYACDRPDDPHRSDAYGPCRSATTTLDRVADAESYVELGEMELADAGARVPGFPAGGFSVARDPVAGSFVMVYSPWPGHTDQVHLRTSPGPDGPWSAPIVVELSGCADRLGERQLNCYAGNAQPAFSSGGFVGIGYYDTAVQTFPIRGAFTVALVPWPATSAPSGR